MGKIKYRTYFFDIVILGIALKGNMRAFILKKLHISAP